MDIFFKDNSGNRVGFINSENIKDIEGNRIGFINDNDIKDNSGKRIGFLNGQDFKDNFGNRVGYINGNEIKDTHGNRIGYAESDASHIEMCAAAFLLFGLEAEETQQGANLQERPKRKKPEGLIEWAGTIIGWLIFPFIDNISFFKYNASRKEWWGTVGRMFLLMMLLFLIGFGKSNNGMIIVMLIISIPIILVSLRRMRDIGKPWWWILIPFANFVMCGFFPG
jgi:hypothetical protein